MYSSYYTTSALAGLGVVVVLFYVLIIGAVLAAAIVAAWLMSKSMAKKGYGKESHIMAICFWLGIFGYIYCLTLPNKIKEAREEQIINALLAKEGIEIEPLAIEAAPQAAPAVEPIAEPVVEAPAPVQEAPKVNPVAKFWNEHPEEKNHINAEIVSLVNKKKELGDEGTDMMLKNAINQRIDELQKVIYADRDYTQPISDEEMSIIYKNN